MKNLFKKPRILVLIFSIAALGASALPLSGEAEYREHAPHWRGRDFMSDLTEEQRTTVRETIERMRDEGATRAEIGDEIKDMLKGYGVEIPGTLRLGLPGAKGRIFLNLTQEQRSTVRQTVKRMRENGASRGEIREAVKNIQRDYGIDLREKTESIGINKTSDYPGITTWSYLSPDRGESNITYTLNSRENVCVKIYNTSGRLIQNFEMGIQEPGTHRVSWDGSCENGVRATSGVYIYRVEAGTHAVSKTLIILP